MKSTARSFHPSLPVLAALLIAAACGMSAAQSITQPPLSITKLNSQTVVVSWFGTIGITYQLEKSTNLLTWSLAGAPIAGTNSSVTVNFMVTGQPKSYFRLRPPPPAANTTVFNSSTGLLVIGGNDLANTITVSRNVAGTILVNGGATTITGGTPTVANTKVIEIFGKPGNDIITIDETNGVMPPARIYGEDGNDIITGGTGADALHGGPGTDTLLGRGGADILLGGDGTDTLTGGDADDQVFGDNDNDRMIWNPGDDTDLNEGGGGTDIVEVNGGNGAESFAAAANGTRVLFQRTDPAPFSIDIGTCENLVLNANGGNDTFAGASNLAALILLTVDGGAGDDILTGSNGADVIIGGDGNDTIDGNFGGDTIFAGAGADTIKWDPGDGSDVIEGQADADKLLFNGSNADESIAITANGGRVLFTRNVAAITMDIDDIETIEYNAFAGADSVVVNNLAGTDVTTVITDLASSAGVGDAVVDNITVKGTTVDDVIIASLQGSDFSVSGLSARVIVAGFDAAQDKVTIQTVEGDDIVDASAAPAGTLVLTVEGGAGNDILLGGAGADTLNGGDNDDVLLGGPGADTLDGVTGENVVIADGTNVTGNVATVFGDGNANSIVISRDIAGALFTNGAAIPGATVANTSLIRVFGLAGSDVITMDETNGLLPRAFLFGGAGSDTITGGSNPDIIFGGINNDPLSGRGGTDFIFGGAGADTITPGDADDAAWGEADNDRMIWNTGDDSDVMEGGGGTDIMEVNGGNGAEEFSATPNGTRVSFNRVTPAPFAIDIGTTENLVLNANGGNDTFSAGSLAGLITLTVDGGAGDDILSGSNGADVIIGGDGIDTIDGNFGGDTIFAGAGADTIKWDPGDGSDTIEGQGDADTLLFNGSNASENIVISPSGGRILLTRNVGAVTMDLNDVETIEYHALAGVDNVTVNNLAGTDVTTVIADLAASAGGGDAAVDTITVNGTAAVDNFALTATGSTVNVLGLAAAVRITGSEFVNDDLIINGLAGIDTISTGSGVTGLIGVTFIQ